MRIFSFMKCTLYSVMHTLYMHVEAVKENFAIFLARGEKH